MLKINDYFVPIFGRSDQYFQSHKLRNKGFRFLI